jgi:hypothetical protein
MFSQAVNKGSKGKKRSLIQENKEDNESLSTSQSDNDSDESSSLEEGSLEPIEVYQVLDSIIDRVEESADIQLLTLTAANKEKNLKFIAHVFGDAFIGGLACNEVSLEGHFSLEILEHVLKYLDQTVSKFQNPELEALTHALHKAYQRSKDWDDELKKLKDRRGKKSNWVYEQFAKYAKELIEEIRALSPNESMILVSGWTNRHGGGHALYKKITKLPTNKYKVTVYNSGAGLTHHLKYIEWEYRDGTNQTIEKYVASVSATDISPETLEDEVLWRSFVEYTHGHFVDVRDEHSANANSIYLRFLKTVSPEFGSSLDDNIGIKRREQISGTCTVKGLFALIYAELPMPIYKVQFKLDLRLALLKEIDQYLKNNFTRIQIDDINSALQKADEEILSLKRDIFQLSSTIIRPMWGQEDSPYQWYETYWQDLFYNKGLSSNINGLDSINQSMKRLKKAVQQKEFLSGLKDSRSEMRLFELSLQKTVRSIFKLVEKGLLPEETADKHLQFMQQLDNRIKSVQDWIYNTSKVNLPNALHKEESPWTFPRSATKKKIKITNQETPQYKNKFLDEVDGIVQQGNVVAMLQQAKKLLNRCVNKKEYFIHIFFKKLPSVDLNNSSSHWTSLNKEDNQACMEILHELMQSWYETNTSNFIFNDRSRIVYVQKIFAIIHQLYHQYNTLPTDVMLRLSHHDKHLDACSSYRAKNPYLTIHDPQCDEEINHFMAYFKALPDKKDSKAKLFAIESVHSGTNSIFVATENKIEDYEGEVLFIQELLQKDPTLEKRIRKEMKSTILDSQLAQMKISDEYKDNKSIQKLSIDADKIPTNWVILYLMSSHGLPHLPAAFHFLKIHTYLTYSILYSENNFFSNEFNSGVSAPWSFSIEFFPKILLNDAIEKISYGKGRLRYSYSNKFHQGGIPGPYQLNQLNQLSSSSLLLEHSDLIRLCNTFPQTNNQAHIINHKSQSSSSLAEQRSLLLLWCFEHRDLRVAKIIEYFSAVKAKLNQKEYQMLFYSAVFESQIIYSNFKNEPLLAKHLFDFLIHTYLYFEEKMSLPGMTFCLRLLGMLEPFFRNLTKQFDRDMNYIAKLETYIQSDKFNDIEKGVLHYEKLFLLSYTDSITKESIKSYLESIIYISRLIKSDKSKVAYMDLGIVELGVRVFKVIYHSTQVDPEFSVWLNNTLKDIFHRVYPEFQIDSQWKISNFMEFETEEKECVFHLEKQTTLYHGGGLNELPEELREFYDQVKIPKQVLYYPFKGQGKSVGGRTYEFTDEYLNKNYIHHVDYKSRDAKKFTYEKEISGLTLRYTPFSEEFDEYGFSNRYSQWKDVHSNMVYFLLIDQSKIVMKFHDNQIQYIEQGDKQDLFLVRRQDKTNSYDVFSRFDEHYCVWKNRNNEPVYIELPHYNLHFRIQYQPCFSIISVEYPDFSLTQCQSMIHLVGFEHYLVLENTEDKKRLVFIPKHDIAIADSIESKNAKKELAGRLTFNPETKTGLFYTYDLNDYDELESVSNEENLYLAYIYLVLRRYEYIKKLFLKLLVQTKSLSRIEESYLMDILLADFIQEAPGISIRLLAAVVLCNQINRYGEKNNVISFRGSIDPSFNLSTKISYLLSRYFLNNHSVGSFALSQQQLTILLGRVYSTNSFKTSRLVHNEALLMNFQKSTYSPPNNKVPSRPLLKDINRSFLDKVYIRKGKAPSLDENTVLSSHFVEGHYFYLYKLARFIPKNVNNLNLKEQLLLKEQKKLRTLLQLNKINTDVSNELRLLQLVIDYPYQFPLYELFAKSMDQSGASEANPASKKRRTHTEIPDKETFITRDLLSVITQLIPHEKVQIPYYSSCNIKTARIINSDLVPIDIDVSVQNQDLNTVREAVLLQTSQLLSSFYKIDLDDVASNNQELKHQIIARLQQAGIDQSKTLKNRLNSVANEVDAYYHATRMQKKLFFLSPIGGFQSAVKTRIYILSQDQQKREHVILETYAHNRASNVSLLRQKYHDISEQRLPKNIHNLIHAYYCYETHTNELERIAPDLYCDISNHSELQKLKTEIEVYLIESCELQRLKRILQILNKIEKIASHHNMSTEDKSLLDKLQNDLITELEFKRWYDLNQRKEFLLFEYYSNLFIREAQIHSMNKLLRDNMGNEQYRKGIILQMQPGDGKTLVILPLLALSLADGTVLSMQIIPEELMDATATQLSAQAFHVYKRFFCQLNWENTSLSNLRLLYTTLCDMIKERRPLLVTDKELHLFFLQERMLELSYNEALMAQRANPDIEKSLVFFRKIRTLFQQKTKVITEECDLIWDLRHQVHISYADSLPVSQDFHDLAAIIYQHLVTDSDINKKVRFSFSKTSEQVDKVYTDELFDEIKPLLIQKLMHHLFREILSPDDLTYSIVSVIRSEIILTDELELLISNYFNQKDNNNDVLEYLSRCSERVQKAIKFIMDELTVYLKATIPQKFERHYGFFSDDEYIIDYFMSQFILNKGSEKELICYFIDVLKERELNFEKIMYDPRWPTELKKAILNVNEKYDTTRSSNLKSNQHSGLRNLFNAMDLAGPFKGAKKPKFGSELGNEIEVINLTIQGRLERGITLGLFKKEVRRLQDQAWHEKNNHKNKTLYQTKAHQRFISMCGEDYQNTMWLGLTEKEMAQIVQHINSSPKKIIQFLRLFVLPSLYMPEKRLTSNDKILVDLFTNEKGTFVDGITGTPDKADTYHHHLEVYAAPFVSGKIISILCEKSWNDVYSFEEESSVKLLDNIFNHNILKHVNALIDMGALFKDMSNLQIAHIVLEKTDPHKIEAVRFFQGNQLMILLRKTSEAKPYIKNLVPSELCFSIYDQLHCTGIDLEHGALATAIVTQDIRDTFRDLKQSPYRMRGLDKKQKVYFLISNQLKNILSQTVKDRPLDSLDCIIYSIKIQCQQELIDNPTAVIHHLTNETYRNTRAFLDSLPLKMYSSYAVKQLINNFVISLQEKNAAKKLGYFTKVPVLNALYDYKNKIIDTFNNLINSLGNELTRVSRTPLFYANGDLILNTVLAKNVLEDFITCQESADDLGVSVEQHIMVQQSVQQEIQLDMDVEMDGTNSDPNKSFTPSTHLITYPYWSISDLELLIKKAPVATQAGYEWLRGIMPHTISVSDSFYHHGRYNQPFDLTQKDISCILVVLSKKENEPRFILLSSVDVKSLLNLFNQASLTQAPFTEYYMGMYMLDIGIIKNGPEELPSELWSRQSTKVALAVLKFMNGVLDYTEEEQTVLLDVFKKLDWDALDTLERDFIKNKLKYKTSRELYPKSNLKHLLDTVKEMKPRVTASSSSHVSSYSFFSSWDSHREPSPTGFLGEPIRHDGFFPMEPDSPTQFLNLDFFKD